MVGLMHQAFPGIWVVGAASGPQSSHPTSPNDGQVQLPLALSWLCPSLEQTQHPPPQTSLQHLYPSTLVWDPLDPSRAVCHLQSLCLPQPHPLVSTRTVPLPGPSSCPLFCSHISTTLSSGLSQDLAPDTVCVFQARVQLPLGPLLCTHMCTGSEAASECACCTSPSSLFQEPILAPALPFPLTRAGTGCCDRACA